MRVQVSRELAAVICSLPGEIIAAVGEAVVRPLLVLLVLLVLLAAGSVVGGCRALAGSGEIPGRDPVSGEAMRTESQPAETGDASLGLMRGADSEKPIYP